MLPGHFSESRGPGGREDCWAASCLLSSAQHSYLADPLEGSITIWPNGLKVLQPLCCLFILETRLCRNHSLDLLLQSWAAFSKGLYLGTQDTNSPEKVWPLMDGGRRVHTISRVTKRQKGGFAIDEAPRQLSIWLNRVEAVEFGFVG